MGAVGALLEGIGEDATSGESVRSARSYASWFLEATSGYYREVGDGEGGDGGSEREGEMVVVVVVVVVPLTSQCEHHLLPFEGKVGVMLVGGAVGGGISMDTSSAGTTGVREGGDVGDVGDVACVRTIYMTDVVSRASKVMARCVKYKA